MKTAGGPVRVRISGVLFKSVAVGHMLLVVDFPIAVVLLVFQFIANQRCFCRKSIVRSAFWLAGSCSFIKRYRCSHRIHVTLKFS
jgi:hypothetical protein